jgi:hypothetical protein
LIEDEFFIVLADVEREQFTEEKEMRVEFSLN